MPEIIDNSIPVPGGKTIEEFVGRASGGTGVSVAHGTPAGWDEPFKLPHSMNSLSCWRENSR